MSKDNSNMQSSWNDADGWIKSCRMNFIEPIYPLLEAEQWEAARKKITSLTNYTIYYIEKAKKEDVIDSLKVKMNCTKTSKFKQLELEGKKQETVRLTQESVSAMYQILKEINKILAGFHMFVKVSKKVDWLVEANRDD